MKEIINFIEENVNGKTLFTKELVYELEDGTLQGVYSDQISFSNFKYSQSGLQIDMFIISNEKIWLIGKKREREKLRKDFSSVSLFRFELAKRKSTNAITGYFRFVSASGKNVAAEAIVSGIYDVRLENGVLNFIEGWNAVEQPLLFLKSQSNWPLSMYMNDIVTDNLGIAMAASLLSLIPAMLVFLYGQTYLELGIQAGGIKA